MKGEIRTYVDDSGSHKVVVLSNDGITNATGWPLCAPVIRQVAADPDLAVYLVPTNQADPVKGFVVLLNTRPMPVEYLTDPEGALVGATVARINDGLKDLFDLS